MDTISRNVNDLTSADRAALEHVLGRALLPNQQIVIAVLPADAQTALSREASRGRLLKLLQETSQRALAAGISPEEADARVREAMETVRPGFRSL